jgi:hypothetical protein
MTTTPGSFTFFSQDGLDTIFWGFVFVLGGTLLALLGIAHFAFSILGAIAAIIGWIFAIMGMSSLRRDYRTRVQTRGPSPPPPPASATTPTCPTCGGTLTFVPQYQRWYCPVDQKYI